MTAVEYAFWISYTDAFLFTLLSYTSALLLNYDKIGPFGYI